MSPSRSPDAGGAYTISGIDPGTYNVREVAQEPLVLQLPDALLERHRCEGDEDIPRVAAAYEETFTSSDDPTGNDFGNWTTPATKSAAPSSRTSMPTAQPREEGEPGLEGWTIEITSTTTTTAISSTRRPFGGHHGRQRRLHHQRHRAGHVQRTRGRRRTAGSASYPDALLDDDAEGETGHTWASSAATRRPSSPAWCD